MKYIIDTNILITAWKITYPIDVFPSFWEQLENKFISGDIVICESVYEELKRIDDDLWKWFHNTIKTNSIPVEKSNETEIIDAYSCVINKANENNRYYSSALIEFGNNADGWIIAHALANGYTLVTEEKPNTDRKKSVKIPDICLLVSVEYINTVKMLQQLGFKF